MIWTRVIFSQSGTRISRSSCYCPHCTNSARNHSSLVSTPACTNHHRASSESPFDKFPLKMLLWLPSTQLGEGSAFIPSTQISLVSCQSWNPLERTTTHTHTNLRKLLCWTGLSKIDNHLLPGSRLLCCKSVVRSDTSAHAHARTHRTQGRTDAHTASSPLCTWSNWEMVGHRWKLLLAVLKPKHSFYRAVVQERTASIFILQHI